LGATIRQRTLRSAVARRVAAPSRKDGSRSFQITAETPVFLNSFLPLRAGTASALPKSAMAFNDTDFQDDLATLVAERRTILSDDAPPALPFALKRRTVDESAWLASLPEQTRAVLEAAREHAADWPRVSRHPGAIARPLHKIPSLRPAR